LRENGFTEEGLKQAFVCIAYIERYREGIVMLLRVIVATGLVLAASNAIAITAKPKPASALVITNAREVPATDIAIGANGQTVRVTKPLASKAKTTLKLPKMPGCMVVVAANFADESTVQMDEFDVCKDSTVRFTD
jgi:hypothetical protein